MRVAIKMTALLVVTTAAAVAAWLARLAFRGRTRPSAWAGSRLCSLWSRAACRILRIRLHVRGGPRGAPFVVAANHVTYLDIWVLGSLYPSIFVAKREIARWPLFGWVASTAGTLFVDRERARDVIRAGRAMTEHLEARIPLTVFPEGGTSHGEAVRPFLSPILDPVAEAGVPCFAASLSYDTPGEAAPPGETVCWTGGKPPFLTHLRRLMTLTRIDVTVIFSGEPVVCGDRKELARRLHDEVRRTFVPVRQTAVGAAAPR